MKIIKHILTTFLLFLFIGYAYFSWTLSDRILTSDSSLERSMSRIESIWGSTFEEQLSPLPDPTDFALKSFDGTAIKGKYFIKNDTADCAVILCHGWTSTWAGMLKYVPVLEDCPCDLVMYDHRAHGESGGEYPTGGIKESKDLLSVTEWVEREKDYSPKQIGWVGASWGGATVLQAGAAEKNVAFILADAPFQDWYSAIFERAIREYGSPIDVMSTGVMQVVNWRAGIDYKEANVLKVADKIQEPVLLIHSATDSQTGSQQSVNISKKLNPRSVFHHLDWGGDHTEDVRVRKERFKGLVNGFLKKLDGRFFKEVGSNQSAVRQSG